VRTKHRDALQKHLSARGIETIIHYPIPLHLQPVYTSLGYQRGDFPIAEQTADEELSLPMYPELADGQVQQIVESVRDFQA
jgi:dTDP-4-amino-4,6-dideoxygalactose transaminase